MGIRGVYAYSKRAQRREGEFSRVSQRIHSAVGIRRIPEDERISARNHLLQGAAAHAPWTKSGRFASRALGQGIFSRTAERCGCDGQGQQALRRYGRLGLLQ